MSHSGRAMVDLSARRRPTRRWKRATAAGAALAVGLVVLAAPPAGAAEHEVRPGETLTVIARRYGTTVGELVRLNALSDPNHLLVGATLQVPGRAGQGTARSSAPSSSSSRKLAPATSAVSRSGGPQFDISASEQLRTAQLLQRAAVEYDVPATLLMALTYTESRWRQDAVSASGAVGVGQLLPETATWLAGLMGQSKLDVRQRADNIRMSAFLLRLLLDRTPTPTHALASYYQGIGAVLSRGLSPAGARYAAVIAGRRAWFG